MPPLKQSSALLAAVQRSVREIPPQTYCPLVTLFAITLHPSVAKLLRIRNGLE